MLVKKGLIVVINFSTFQTSISKLQWRLQKILYVSYVCKYLFVKIVKICGIPSSKRSITKESKTNIWKCRKDGKNGRQCQKNNEQSIKILLFCQQNTIREDPMWMLLLWDMNIFYSITLCWKSYFQRIRLLLQIKEQRTFEISCMYRTPQHKNESFISNWLLLHEMWT